MSESKTNRIENPDVANVVAYATYPQENTARVLESYGLGELTAEQRAKIDKVSVDALTEWVEEASPAAMDHRAALVEEARPLFHRVVETESTDNHAEISAEPPQFKGIGPELAARAVGYLLTHTDGELYMAKITKELGGMTQSQMSKIMAQLSEKGYVIQEPGYDRRLRRPRKNLTPTDQLRAEADIIPLWREKVQLFELAKQLGMSDTETERYLLKLGRTMLLGNQKS